MDDLYVRFFRLAERRIAEMSGRGVVSFISNFSYLGDPSFVVMRQRFLAEFDKLWLDCLNGDSRETGKLTPEGKPDPSVFSTGLQPRRHSGRHRHLRYRPQAHTPEEANGSLPAVLGREQTGGPAGQPQRAEHRRGLRAGRTLPGEPLFLPTRRSGGTLQPMAEGRGFVRSRTIERADGKARRGPD